MKKTTCGVLAVIVAVLVVALPVLAATTWSSVSTGVPVYARGAKGTFTTGTDPGLATTTSTSLGIELKGLGGVSIEAEAIGTMTAGGKFLAYVLNPATGHWVPVSDGSLDLTVAAVPRQAWSGLTVSTDMGRIAWEPSGVGTTVDLYIFGASRVLSPR